MILDEKVFRMNLDITVISERANMASKGHGLLHEEVPSDGRGVVSIIGGRKALLPSRKGGLGIFFLRKSMAEIYF